MRIRIAELMREHDPPLKTAYALAQASGRLERRISLTTAHRLVTTEGRPERVELDTLEALCDLFGVGPDELLERDPAPAKRARGK